MVQLLTGKEKPPSHANQMLAPLLDRCITHDTKSIIFFLCVSESRKCQTVKKSKSMESLVSAWMAASWSNTTCPPAVMSWPSSIDYCTRFHEYAWPDLVQDSGRISSEAKDINGKPNQTKPKQGNIGTGYQPYLPSSSIYSKSHEGSSCKYTSELAFHPHRRWNGQF